MPSCNNERGGILILTFWLVAFLSIMILILGQQILVERRALAAYSDRAQMPLALETMRARFLAALEFDDSPNFDALNDSWSHDAALFQNVQTGAGSPTLSLAADAHYGAVDEERFININLASFSLLKQLFIVAADKDDAEAELLASAVQDWRDLETSSSSPQMDTEGSLAYPNYPCKNDLFESREELMLVYGMDETIYKSIRPVITIYGEGKVNINTAPRGVLSVLGAPDSLVEKIVSYRAGEDQTEGTEDDGVFETLGDVEVQLLAQWGELATEELNAINKMKSENWLDVKANYFRLPVEMKSRGRTLKKNLVADRTGTIWEVGT